MGWYIIFGIVAVVGIGYILHTIIEDIKIINYNYEKEMKEYENEKRIIRVYDVEPEKQPIKGLGMRIGWIALVVAPILITAFFNLCTYVGNLHLAETYRYLLPYETYAFGNDYDSLAIKNQVLISFDEYNKELSLAKVNTDNFSFWTFDDKDIINSLDYLVFK